MWLLLGQLCKCRTVQLATLASNCTGENDIGSDALDCALWILIVHAPVRNVYTRLECSLTGARNKRGLAHDTLLLHTMLHLH